MIDTLPLRFILLIITLSIRSPGLAGLAGPAQESVDKCPDVQRWREPWSKYCEQVKGTRVVEDEYHFLTQCPLYQRHRVLVELQKKVGWSLDKKSCSEVEKTVQNWMKNGINVKPL